MDPVKTLNSHVPGLVAHIYPDHDPHYDFDTLGTITYNSHARTVLGVVPKTAEEDAEIARKVRDGEYIGLPVWAYVHGGATVKAAMQNPFGCPWDSGQSGWVYVPMAKALKEYGRKLPSKKFKHMIQRLLIEEVKTFDMYLRGEVYGFSIEHNGNTIDSCGGYYMDIDEMVKEVEGHLDYQASLIAPMRQVELPLEFAGAQA